MEKLYSVRCNPDDAQATGKEDGGIFDFIDSELESHALRQSQSGGHYYADFYSLDKRKNHKQIFECIHKKQIKHEFTFQEAFFLINKTAQLFPWEAEWRFIVYLYSTSRYLSVVSRKISKGGNPQIEKRIIFCRETKPFYDYPAGTGILLRF